MTGVIPPDPPKPDSEKIRIDKKWQKRRSQSAPGIAFRKTGTARDHSRQVSRRPGE
jgi:hypothetical protein